MYSSLLSLGLFHSNQYNSTLFNGSLEKNFLKLYLGNLNMKTWDIYVLVRLHVKYFETKCTFKTWQLFSSLFFHVAGPIWFSKDFFVRATLFIFGFWFSNNFLHFSWDVSMFLMLLFTFSIFKTFIPIFLFSTLSLKSEEKLIFPNNLGRLFYLILSIWGRNVKFC